jgi:uncharacterized membrane protein
MPLSVDFWEVSLWLAVTSMTLLITSGLFSFYGNRINLYMNGKRLRNVAIAVSILFLVTVVISAVRIILFA